MAVDFTRYEIYQPLLPKPAEELSRKQAQAEFDQLMAVKDYRIEQLRRVLAEDGVVLADDHEAINAVNEWFISVAEPSPTEPGWIRGRTISLGVDISLHLGDVLIRRYPHLYWGLVTDGNKRMVSYHEPAVFGFPFPELKYDMFVDFKMMVLSEGAGAASGFARHGEFNRFMSIQEALARGEKSW